MRQVAARDRVHPVLPAASARLRSPSGPSIVIVAPLGARVTRAPSSSLSRLYQGWRIIEHVRPSRCGNLWGHPGRTVCELIITNYAPPPATEKP